MQRKLYKVKVETELMVMALNKREAEEIAKKNAVNEVSVYGQCNSSIIKHSSDIPKDWKDIIPYGTETATQETRKCIEIFADIHGEDMGAEDLDELVEIQKKSKHSVPPVDKQKNEVVPETRPDPKPRELGWTETHSGRPLPHLRFNIPGGK
jgi:hypothetical protein